MVNKHQPSEEADSRGPHKEMPPYYAQRNGSSTDSWDPSEGPLYFLEKMFPPLSASTHRKCFLITHKKMNTPPASWDPPWWEANLWAY